MRGSISAFLRKWRKTIGENLFIDNTVAKQWLSIGAAFSKRSSGGMAYK